MLLSRLQQLSPASTPGPAIPFSSTGAVLYLSYAHAPTVMMVPCEFVTYFNHTSILNSLAA